MKIQKDTGTKEYLVLECKRVKFFGPCDKDAFFEWIERIKFITRCEGERDSILLYSRSKRINNEDLRNLYGLFRRYKVDTKQLEVFVNKKNKDIFEYLKKGFSICVYPAKRE